ncbi:MAG: acyl carrier protein [Lachnospiraceae bacterium]|nr:acyl carrier protein [Lachnospiraceae bacterium]
MKEKIEMIFRELMEWDTTEEVTDDMSPENVTDWDSLITMSLILQLEKEFSIKFVYDEVINMDTIGDIKRIVADKLA